MNTVKQVTQKDGRIIRQEHQDLIKANIAEAESNGDKDRAEYLRKVFAPLLALDLTTKETC
jgi:hypothetical protein